MGMPHGPLERMRVIVANASTDNLRTSWWSTAFVRVGGPILVLGLTALFLVVPVRLEHPAYDGVHRNLGDMRYGWPLDWLSQNQQSMDPPAGNSQSFCEIRQCPTTILWSGLTGNILLLWVGLVILALALAGLVRTIRNRET